MEKEELKLLKNRTGGERLADTLNFLRINLGILIRTHFLLSLPVIIVTAALFVVLFPDYFSLLGTIGTGPFQDTIAERTERTQTFIELLFSTFAVMPIGINTLIVFDQYARNNGAPVKFEGVWASFKRHFLKLYIAKVLMAIVIGFASLLLIIPGLVFYNLFLLTEMLILQNGFSIGKAIGRSTSVMSTAFWTPFWTNLGFFLIMGAAALAMAGMVPLFEWIASLLVMDIREGSFLSILGISIGIFNTILGYMLYMLPSAGAGIQYFTLREEIGRTNITQRIRAIGTDEVPVHQLRADEEY